MICLLYGIFPTPPAAGGLPRPIPGGVGGRPVFPLAQNGLTAAVSVMGTTFADVRATLFPAEISRLLEYGKVVEALLRDPAVTGILPLRYGSILEKSLVQRHLEEHGPEYEALLKVLEGCVEMGVRILRPPAHREKDRIDPGGKPARGGREYLLARRGEYERESRLDRELRNLADDLCRVLAGLFHRYRLDDPARGPALAAPPPPTPLRGTGAHPSLWLRSPSLSFLVPRVQVAAFRQSFALFPPPPGVQLSLNGPWPPYNFAQMPKVA